MNYFSNFLGLTFLGAFLIYIILIFIDGAIGLKDFFKSIRLWKR